MLGVLISRAGARKLLAAVFAIAALCTATLVRAEGPYLTLIETVADPVKNWAGNWTAQDGAVTNDLYGDGSYATQHTWSSPPAQIDAAGFTLSMQVAGSLKSECAPMFAGTQMSSGSFEFGPNPASVGIDLVPPPNCNNSQGRRGNKSGSFTAKPIAGLADGQVVELKLSAAYGPGMTYRYRVSASSDGSGDGTDDDGTTTTDDHLAAHIECPPTIVISELPSLNCHIVITSWRRNTADPVEVILPNALDFYGNHSNGIQLLQAAGEQDVFNWDAPYRWGMFVFACDSQSGTGANCFGSSSTPGVLATVRIIVAQGDEQIELLLTITPLARPGSQTISICGFPVSQAILDKWLQTGGQPGVLGCATGPEQDAPRSATGAEGRMVSFEGGIVVLHSTGQRSGAILEVHGSIGTRYLALGGAGSWLGYPAGEELDIPGGRRAEFENGFIMWDRLTGGSTAMRDGANLFSLETNTNRGGADFLSFPAIDDRVEVCRDACAAEQSCVAYTYVVPGLQGPRAMCWLKSGLPPAAPDSCCTSGVRR